MIVDFAPHELEFLREQYAHRRLGFAPEVVNQWLGAAGLELHGGVLFVGDHATGFIHA